MTMTARSKFPVIPREVIRLEDRAIILHFCPPNDEVHRKVGQWFDDSEVYQFLGELLPVVPTLSMRHYSKGSQLRRAGLSDWRNNHCPDRL